MGRDPALPMLRLMLGETVHARNPSTQKAEAGRLREFKPSLARDGDRMEVFQNRMLTASLWEDHGEGRKSKGERVKML